ncbi:MAG: hypothetical protein NT150_10770, partial [Bacteroidetes bacterium]|nr:hypothetical protein [Bacteroidota bacterium]
MNNFKCVQLQLLTGLLFLFAFNSNAQTCVAVSPNEPWTWPGHNNWFFAAGNGWTGQTYKWAPVAPGPIAPAITTQGTVGSNAVSNYEGSAVVSDDSGNLVFFANGRKLWDGTGALKYSGLLTGNEGGLTGNNGSACQGVLAVRHPLLPNTYYVFTTDDANQGTTVGFNYFVFDQNGNNIAPLGANRLGAYRTMEGVAATRHANGVDVWITVYESGSNNFNSYLLTCTGLNTVPVVSAVAPTIFVADEERGGIAFSWDSKRFAQVHPNSTGGASDKEVSVYDFNNSTGVISNPLHISSLMANELPYDVLFSPDNSKLYYSTATGQVGYYDLSSGIAATILTTQTFLTIAPASTHAALEIGPDGKLYQANGGNGLPMRQIDGDLNAGGAGAFTLNSIAGTETSKGLPSMYIAPQDYVNISAAGPICNTSGTTINLSANWLCAGTNAEDPIGNPTGWSGTGITDAANGVFDPTGLAAGPYIITYTYKAACVTVTGTVTITVTSCICNSVGGNVTADATVCSGTNSGTLTLAGQNGSVIRWESSTDNFATTTNIANVTTSQNYSNISTTTKYRAVVKDASCPSDNSSVATITVDAASVGGTVTTEATVCSGANGATLTLAGNTGDITGWESSTDDFLSSTPIVNVTSTQDYLNLTTTTKFRAIVKSGVCASTTSAFATITVDPITVGGTVNADATVCSGANSGTLNLVGSTGSVTGWESSTDGFLTATPISNVSTSQPYNNIAVTTQYRAIVKSGSCSSVNSNPAMLTVDAASVGGTVTADATVCSGSNSGTLTLAGNTGAITGWESSTDGFSTATPIANVTSTQAYLNLTASTQYRAIVKSGVCSADNSVLATITVDPLSVGGTVTADATVCAGTNSGTLNLVGKTGDVTGWESSTDDFLTSTPIANITSSLVYTNIALTTKYRAIITSGTCVPANSSSAVITVDAVSVGGVVTTDTAVCSGTNSGTLFLAGNTGTITGWESSTNNFVSATPIINATSSYSYNNLSATTQFRAIVKSGVCSVDNSSSATITVNPWPTPTVANHTICAGDPAATFDAGVYTSYLWSANGTGMGQTTSGILAGNYTVEVTDGNGCKASATGVLTVNALPVVSLEAASVCQGGSITLTPSPALWAEYEWNSNPLLNTATLSYSLPNTTATVRVKDANGCFNTASAFIALGDTLHVDFGGDKQICSYSSVTLDAAQYGPFAAPVLYKWDNVIGTSTKTINVPGSYGVTVMDSRGCMGSD